jgi:hypothetical protein
MTTTTRAEKKADKNAEKLARKQARSAESARKKAEKQGRTSESARKKAEKQGGTSESARKKAEKQDDTTPSARQQARAARAEQKATKQRGSNRGDFRRTVRLFRRFKGSPKIYVVGMTLLVFEAATAVIEPIPIAWLIDFLGGKKPNIREMGGPALLTSERFETILVLTLAVVLIAAINSAADSLTEICMARGGRSLGYSIRTAMYSHLQRLPLAYHDSKRTGDVLTRVTGDVLVVEEFIVKSVSNIVGSLLVLLGSFTLLMFQSWRVALISLVVVPLLAFVSRNFSIRI